MRNTTGYGNLRIRHVLLSFPAGGLFVFFSVSCPRPPDSALPHPQPLPVVDGNSGDLPSPEAEPHTAGDAPASLPARHLAASAAELGGFRLRDGGCFILHSSVARERVLAGAAAAERPGGRDPPLRRGDLLFPSSA